MDRAERGRMEAVLYRESFDDGLVDVLFGVIVAAWGVGLLVEFGMLGAETAAALLPVYALLRSRLIEPRTGRVEWSEGRKEQEQRTGFMAALLGVGVLGFSLVIAGLLQDAGGALVWVGHAVPALLLSLPALIIAFAIGSGWFVGYATALLAGGGAGLAGVEPPVYSIVVGGGIAVVGLARLVSYLRRHPVLEG